MDNYSFQDVLGTSATISTVLQFLTGSCFLWLKYGMLTQEHVVIFVNIIGSVPNLLGCLLSAIQLMLYVIYPNRSTYSVGPAYQQLRTEEVLA
ncbi:conserved hypothetical protein [Culex quinquefasciatus]|uniref:Uncharacterized protein n=1 Tax=Culex quinquefasciatus TaxID=7176 RepID=B0XH76_CULQU|nr:conserved hypothetical protein [Culex quinquefasciatus]|eukprot:XP_001868998.1 conserved hypothetical protein [Culex quinquefasciatus]